MINQYLLKRVNKNVKIFKNKRETYKSCPFIYRSKFFHICSNVFLCLDFYRVITLQCLFTFKVTQLFHQNSMG